MFSSKSVYCLPFDHFHCFSLMMRSFRRANAYNIFITCWCIHLVTVVILHVRCYVYAFVVLCWFFFLLLLPLPLLLFSFSVTLSLWLAFVMRCLPDRSLRKVSFCWRCFDYCTSLAIAKIYFVRFIWPFVLIVLHTYVYICRVCILCPFVETCPAPGNKRFYFNLCLWIMKRKTIHREVSERAHLRSNRLNRVK